MSDQNNNMENEVLQSIKKFIVEYDKREKSKVRMARIGALIKASFIVVIVFLCLCFMYPF